MKSLNKKIIIEEKNMAVERTSIVPAIVIDKNIHVIKIKNDDKHL